MSAKGDIARSALHNVLLALALAPAAGQDLFVPSLRLVPAQPPLPELSPRPVAREDRPNLVWFLTDDQDQVLGSSFPLTSEATPMPKTKRLLQDAGAHATNWYIHTPICSPSRSELLTGRYFHNVKQVGGADKGKNCTVDYCGGMHVNYTLVNNNTFAKTLQEEGGYIVGMFGKYLNTMPREVPPGFDAWFANGGGNYIAPGFQTKNIDGLPDGWVQFTNAPANYSTAVIGNTSIAWIRKVAKQGKPFMAYIAPKAAHEPYNPAPWYRDHWDPSWPAHEPRPPNWNCSFEARRGHPGVIATEPLITEEASRIITGIFKNRWRTLMSVDDVIGDVIDAVDELGLLDRTYFFYSSDHGFQLGEFNIPMDKRHVYEWDTKIHLLARGPGIDAGSVFEVMGTQVDIAPTLLGLAGLRAPTTMDGRSIVPFLLGSNRQGEVLPATLQHLQELGDLATYRASWREEVFLEYYFVCYNTKCTTECPAQNYPYSDANCADLANNADCWCPTVRRFEDPTCYATESESNNYIALRQIGQGKNQLYVEYQNGDLYSQDVDFSKVDFVEHYDLTQDPWEMNNRNATLTEADRAALHARLRIWLSCAGSSCP